MKEGIKIYQKENKLGLFKILKDSFSDMFSSRFLSFQLAKRDIKALYRQSFLGVLWAFAPPIATAMVWIFLRSSGTVDLTDTGVPYPLFVFTGTMLWSIIIESINSPISSTTSAKSILTKINFSKEALIISGCLKVLFNTAIKVILLIGFMVYYQLSFSWLMLFLPLGILIMIFVGTTIGLLITPMGMLYKDIARGIKFGFQFLMYITPVVFALPEKEGFSKTIMELNPFTPLILTVRNLLLGVMPEHFQYFTVVVLCCIPLFLISLIIYRISIPIFVERLSS